jgi:hypothetical protein
LAGLEAAGCALLVRVVVQVAAVVLDLGRIQLHPVLHPAQGALIELLLPSGFSPKQFMLPLLPNSRSIAVENGTSRSSSLP